MPRMVSETKPAQPTNAARPSQSFDDMRIAWRYNNLEKVDSEQGSNSQVDGQKAYTFDLSQYLDPEEIGNLDVTKYDEDCNNQAQTVFHHLPYYTLIEQLQAKLRSEAANESNKNVLRISIESLGSPLWWNENFTQDLCLFLTILRAAVRFSNSVCCLTMPTHLFKYTVRIDVFKKILISIQLR